MINSTRVHKASFQRQRGAATLVTALVLMIIMLGITFYTSETVVTEKKVVANEYRAKQAFNGAQAGLDYGIAYARSGTDQNDDSVLDLSGASGATGSIGSASYSVTLSDLSAGSDMSLLMLESVGSSDDGVIQRTVSVLIGEIPVLPNPPSVPVVARGDIATTGNLQVYNHFENLNMWTGSELDSWGSSDTYVRDPDWTGFGGDTWDGTPGDLERHLTATGNTVVDVPSIQSTTKNTRGPDVIDGDTSLGTLSGSEFIENFFGTDIEGLAGGASETFNSGNFDTSLWPGLSGVIYLDDGTAGSGGTYQISGNGTIGSASSPVVLVVDGDIRLSGNVTIYGLVVARNYESAAGTVDVIGGVMAETEIEKANGTFSVYYDPGVMAALEELKSLEVVRGSWKDW
jgi:hypothetical protein